MNARTFTIEPFDIMLHATEEGVQTLQSRFATWLRTLNSPARFLCWQIPATLDDKIGQVTRTARQLDQPERASLLNKEYLWMARTINLLATFAFFSTVGRKTATGMAKFD